MKNIKLIHILILILVIINLALGYLYFFKGSSHNHGRGDSMHSWLDKNLELTDQQETLHVKMRNQYFTDLRRVNDTIRLIKARFVANSSRFDLSDSMMHYWNDSINRWQSRGDALTYEHVRSLRRILTPSQQPILDSLIQVLMLGKNRK